MECPSCAFQNTPGTRTCVRCQSLLALATVDFIPPRAASGGRRRRVRAGLRTGRLRFVEVMSDIGHFVQAPDPAPIGWGEVPWLIIPGGVQIRSRLRGLRVLGWAVLMVWSLVLLASLATLGTGPSRPLALGSISVHSFAIALAFAPVLQSRSLFCRLVFGLALFVTLLFGIYRPASALLARCVGVMPVAGVGSQGTIANGDVLLYSGAWFHPRDWQRGDLVVTAIEPFRGGGVVVVGGFNVDRIVAIPGDVVHAKAGELTVNGRTVPADAQPIGGIGNLPPIDTTVAEDTYLVFPSALGWRGQGEWRPLVVSTAPEVAFVRSENVLGRVWFRVRPWRRAGPVGRTEE